MTVKATVLVLGHAGADALALMRGKYGEDTCFITLDEYQPHPVRRSTSRYAARATHYEIILATLLNEHGKGKDAIEAVLVEHRPEDQGQDPWQDFLHDFWNNRPVYRVVPPSGGRPLKLQCLNDLEDHILQSVDA